MVWEDVFTPAELDAIVRHGDALVQEGATVTAGRNAGIRVTKVGWVRRVPDIAWLYARMEQLALILNQQYFNFDLFGLTEDFQYTVYHGIEGGHYEWHVDRGPGTVEPRKISFSLQLSEPSDYEGCDLEVRNGNSIDVAPKKRGTLLAFPSFALHRVTPVTAGTRKSLVIWAGGPEFR